MNTLIQDVRYAARTLAKSPGFTAVALAAMAACLVPALRATRIDPNAALRSE